MNNKLDDDYEMRRARRAERELHVILSGILIVVVATMTALLW